ncbi:hypothetical protein [Shewanella glacialipiscicola]|uniref:Uncharacterized protein n=1 Tax=Shewanella glacialipiscicola TaxID=614069 RepID=A0ABQ6J232_9GAMM|nr:hypothetical protein [Shewanella glacialipiscicola]MCL1087448.1 hypothetical protein [Shewanella glacialipiscicola]GMA82196.1 hypothetical protein GCM10025855_17290 [Shewanella glacialipiscicola]
MLVKTVAMKMGVRIEKAEAVDESIVLHGFAGTMPCETIITSAEALVIFKMCFKWSIINILLKSLFSKKSKQAMN